MFNRFIILTALTFLVCIHIGCSDAANNQSKVVLSDTIPVSGRPDKTIPGGFSQPTNLRFDSTMLTRFLDSFPGMNEFKAELTGFYQKRNFSYAWFNDKGMIEPAGNLYNRLQNIAEEGEKETKAMEWLLPRKQTSYAELLDSLISGKNILANEPVYRQYNLLKDYLKKYNAIKANGGWPTITADKKTYRAGDSSELIRKVRNHLFINGDLATDNQSAIFDSTMVLAIKDYIKNPKDSGYKSYHMLVSVPIFLSDSVVDTKVEIQIRTIAMDFWASLEHKIYYKFEGNAPEYISKDLKECAELVSTLDDKMLSLNEAKNIHMIG